jgi:RHS repeat-associated protein
LQHTLGCSTFKGSTKSYNSKNQQTGTGFVYDGNGNPTTYNGATLTFDPENRMTAYGSVLTAGYNGGGLRGWKQNSSARTYFLYDGIVPVVELNSSGSVIATNTFGASGLISRNASGTSVFYSFDSEGNVTQRADAGGNVLSNYFFAAHGVMLSGSLTEPFGYKAQVGYYTDIETGLQLLTHRFYDPNTGRFLTRDPIDYDGGINLYAYTTNNPVNAVDPLGLQKGPQKTPVPKEEEEAYRDRIAEMLEDHFCSNFIKQLLNEVRRQTGRPYLSVFTAFAKTKFYWGKVTSHGGSAYWEDWQHGVRGATIDNIIKTEKPVGSLSNQRDRYGFLISQTTHYFFGETLHSMGVGRLYGDGEFANALNSILVRQGRDIGRVFSDRSERDVSNASVYWHQRVFETCVAPRK